MDILLVVGPVDEKQYQPVVDKMTEQEMNPVVVHINPMFCTDGEFRTAASRLIPRHLSVENSETYVQYWIEQKKRTIIRDAFKGYQPEDVKGVVLFAQGEACTSAVHYDWLLERLPSDRKDHLVYIGENGQTWIEGSYGHIEPLVGV